MSRYFIEQPCPKDILGKRRELPNTNCVGVEFGPMHAVVFLRISPHGLELFGDDSFMISPLATNHLQIIPDETHMRKSRIVEKQSDRGDLREAKLALEHLQVLASETLKASSVRTAAQRENLSAHIRSCIRCIQRAI